MLIVVTPPTWGNNIKYDDIQHNSIQHNAIQHNTLNCDTSVSNIISYTHHNIMLSFIFLTVMVGVTFLNCYVDCCHAECSIFIFMPSVITPSVVKISVAAQSTHLLPKNLIGKKKEFLQHSNLGTVPWNVYELSLSLCRSKLECLSLLNLIILWTML